MANMASQSPQTPGVQSKCPARTDIAGSPPPHQILSTPLEGTAIQSTGDDTVSFPVTTDQRHAAAARSQWSMLTMFNASQSSLNMPTGEKKINHHTDCTKVQIIHLHRK